MNVKLEDTGVYQEAVSERVRSLILRLLKRLFGEIAEEQLEALALALLKLRLRSRTWDSGYKVNQKRKFYAETLK
ncbi:hypothetical protein KBT16_01995 [Nostoc sp. CCCryo 231-06]|nr:hypothetical protein [Nostoc sp. CCCryo 231-06]